MREMKGMREMREIIAPQSSQGSQRFFAMCGLDDVSGLVVKFIEAAR
jgi:hypothetical protein